MSKDEWNGRLGLPLTIAFVIVVIVGILAFWFVVFKLLFLVATGFYFGVSLMYGLAKRE